jgi:hypothetical protein
MAVERHVFKIRHHQCRACKATRSGLAWDYDTFKCCDQQMVETVSAVSQAPAVIGDEIDWTIRHGPVAEDGSPVRYRSRSEWKEACQKTGWTPMGDTPKTREERHRWV